MKVYRLVLAFCILAGAILSICWVAGLINGQQMFDSTGRLFGIIVILGIAGSAVYTILRPSAGDPTQSDSKSREPGPKF